MWSYRHEEKLDASTNVLKIDANDMEDTGRYIQGDKKI